MIFKIRGYMNSLYYICLELKKVQNYTPIKYLHRDLTLHTECGSPNFYEFEEAKSLLRQWCIYNCKEIKSIKTNMNEISYEVVERKIEFITEKEMML